VAENVVNCLYQQRRWEIGDSGKGVVTAWLGKLVIERNFSNSVVRGRNVESH
jgi:hypothetical protein